MGGRFFRKSWVCRPAQPTLWFPNHPELPRETFSSKNKTKVEGVGKAGEWPVLLGLKTRRTYLSQNRTRVIKSNSFRDSKPKSGRQKHLNPEEKSMNFIIRQVPNFLNLSFSSIRVGIFHFLQEISACYVENQIRCSIHGKQSTNCLLEHSEWHAFTAKVKKYWCHSAALLLHKTLEANTLRNDGSRTHLVLSEKKK